MERVYSASLVQHCLSIYPVALYFGRDRNADLPEKQELNTMLLVNLMQSQGRTQLVEDTFREHRRRRRTLDESDTDDDLVLN